MNPQPVKTDSNSEDDIVEMQSLISSVNDLEQGNRASGKAVRMISSGMKTSDGFLQRIGMQLEERFSLKKLLRVWGPRIEFVVRLMLVATYLDDSIRTATEFSQITSQVRDGWLSSLSATSSELSSVIATVAVSMGLITQFVGSLCLIAKLYPNVATIALIGWTILQPILYSQLSNIEFIAESLSLIGGLLLLRAHLVFEQSRHGDGARTQLFGRLLIPTLYIYYSWLFLMSAFSLDETNSVMSYVSSLSGFVINLAALVGLVLGATFVFFGLKSRLVSLILGVVNLGFIFYKYPFFRFAWRENGEWVYDEDNMSMPPVTLPINVDFGSPEFYALVYDLHRYYFFLGLSTSGALLLLAQMGPGEIAVQKSEILLPVARAQD